MAHYAFVDNSNVVTEVIVGKNEGEGVDYEALYAAVRGMRCLRTSYHTQGGVHARGSVPFRLNYAGIGMLYREDIDGFIPPCPGEGWTLDEVNCVWVAAEAD